MRSPPPILNRAALATLAALGLLLPSRVDAGAMSGVVDLGAGVSGLVLGESGQVAGLNPGSDPAPDPSSPSYYYSSYGDLKTKPFEYDRGQFTNLDSGIVPVAVADDGRVIDARGPYPYATSGAVQDYFSINQYATAGNHLGELVGTAINAPYSSGDYMSDPPLHNMVDKTPYLYVPNNLSSSAQVQSILNTPYASTYHTVADVGENKAFGRPEPGTVYVPWWIGGGHEETSGPHPTGINDRGLVIGDIYSVDPKFNTLYDPIKPSPDPAYIHAAVGNQDIGTLGGLNSHAAAVNNSGLVVGSSDTASGASHAFLFTPTSLADPGIGKMIDLGTLPGMTASAAMGINNLGQIVGWSSLGKISDAILISDGIMEDLNARLPATMGIHLDQAVAINDAGQIVAYGHGSDGVEHGYLLPAANTPEPTALAILILAGAGVGVRRLRISKGI